MTIQSQHVSQLGQAAYRQPYVHDRWAPLTHILGTGIGNDLLGVAPGIKTWMPKDDRRRLMAYQVLQAMVDNVRRHWLPSHMWRAKPLNPNGEGLDEAVSFPAALQYREYGDAAMVVDTARSLVLGDEQRPRVPDAEPRRGPGGELVTPSAGSLPVAVQDWLDVWFAKEKVAQKLIETENRAIPLGDGVLVMHWDGDARRPRLSGYDPGFCFPDWSAIESKAYVQQGWKDQEFPPVLHVAWEWMDGDGATWIRRTTWSMRRLDPARRLPYQDGPSPWTCWYEQADYDPAKLDGADVYSFPRSARRVELVPPVDLQVDFMPVVLVPNDYPGSERWGRSLLMSVAQILDDMAAGDTDLALNAETVASPQLIGKNLSATPSTGATGWTNLFGDQDIKLLDTATVLDALIKQHERLRQRLAQNSRLGQVLLGMVSPNDVPSGYSMRLGFASVESLEREMTRVRRTKYDLLLKMAASFASANGLIPAGPLPEIQMVLGKGLPSDRAATIQEVVDLLAAHAISTVTAVALLMEAGIPIEDAQAEVARIQAERTDVAVGIVEATGNVEAAAGYLGVPFVEPAPAEEDPAAGQSSTDVPPAGQPAVGGDGPAARPGPPEPGAPPQPRPDGGRA